MSGTGTIDDPALPDAKRLLDPEAAARLLAGALGEPFDGKRGVLPTYLRHKAGTSLLVAYRTEDGRIVSAKAFADPTQAADAAKRVTSSRLDASGRVLVLPFPADPGLVHLHEILDPRVLRKLVGRGLGRRVVRLRTTVVRYKPERRCLIEVTLPTQERVFVRCLRPQAAMRLRERMSELVSLRVSGLALTHPLAADPRRGAIVEAAVPGKSFARISGYSEHRRAQLLGALGRGLAAVHATPGESLAGERLSDVLGRVERCASSLASFGAALAEPSSELVGALRRRAGRLAGDGRTAVPLHGDLDPSQVLVTASTVYLLDFERSVLGDRARDVGGFVAGCLALDAEGTLEEPLGATLAASLVRAYRRAAPEGALTRLGLSWHIAASLANRALAAVRSCRPGSEALAKSILEQAIDQVRSRVPTPGFGEHA